jgi:branched-chain amino acid transport system substrate-binding protein
MGKTPRMLSVGLLVISLVLAACGVPTEEGATTGTPASSPVVGGSGGTAELKIGAVGSLSGGGTAWGIATQRGVGLAIDEVVAAGGLKVGDQVYTPRLVMYDDQYTGQGGTTAATRLVNEDKVKFIIGPIGSPAVLGVLGVTDPAGVVVLSNGFSPKILSEDKEHNFRVSLTTNEFAPPIVNYLKQTYPDAKRVGMIYPNDEIGQTIVPILVKAYEDAGFEVVAKEPYERGTKDFASLLTRMMSRGVDIFELNSNAPGEAGLLVKQAKQLGFDGVMIQTGGPGIDEVIKVAGAQADGFLSYDIFNPEDPSAQAFVKAYEAKYDGPINAYAPIMYNAAKLLFEAMRRAGSLEEGQVRAALQGLEGHQTLFGPVRWTGKEQYGIEHQLLTDLYVSEVKGGKFAPKTRISP